MVVCCPMARRHRRHTPGCRRGRPPFRSARLHLRYWHPGYFSSSSRLPNDWDRPRPAHRSLEPRRKLDPEIFPFPWRSPRCAGYRHSLIRGSRQSSLVTMRPPHLLNDEDLVAALVSTRRTLVDGGLFIASIRDYDTLRSEHSAGIPPTIMGVHGNRHGYAQAWRWSDDGSQVDISLFVLLETPGGWSASLHETTYRARLRAEMNATLVRAEFSQIRVAHARGHWVLPADRGR